jgi:hypothetical protein
MFKKENKGRATLRDAAGPSIPDRGLGTPGAGRPVGNLHNLLHKMPSSSHLYHIQAHACGSSGQGACFGSGMPLKLDDRRYRLIPGDIHTYYRRHLSAQPAPKQSRQTSQTGDRRVLFAILSWQTLRALVQATRHTLPELRLVSCRKVVNSRQED